jgi:predicted nucleotidyltransferase component of viral defense system
MIHTAKQLKDKVRNISHSNSEVAQALIRHFYMERFLERVSKSKYRDNFILKGGMLVASIIGANLRSTMDIDSSIRALPLNENDAKRIIEEICGIDIEDGVTFSVSAIKTIMEDFDYPGIRIVIEAKMERMIQRFKIDLSTDDVITPKAIEYDYKLMFEERTIPVMTYSLETLLSEKIQTVLSRGLSNTRMRDYYDIYKILKVEEVRLESCAIKKAFVATCKKRKTVFETEETIGLLKKIENDLDMEEMWNKFRDANYFVGELEWKEVLKYDKDWIIKKLF